MSEVALILSNATEKSLVVLDEIGRGTSTFDGLSIAWAVVEYIAKNVKCKTLFATHYHELSELEGVIEGVKNYKITVKEIGDSVVFLRKIVRGHANKSFGVEVAKIAGVPERVIDRAKEISENLERVNKRLDLDIFSEDEERQRAPAHAAGRAEEVARQLLELRSAAEIYRQGDEADPHVVLHMGDEAAYNAVNAVQQAEADTPDKGRFFTHKLAPFQLRLNTYAPRPAADGIGRRRGGPGGKRQNGYLKRGAISSKSFSNSAMSPEILYLCSGAGKTPALTSAT